MVKFVDGRSKELLKQILLEERVQRYLTRLKQHHLETHEHSLRTGLLSLDLGKDFEFDEHSLKLLGYSGLLHDIGKLRVPSEVLSKTTPITEAHAQILYEHPSFGFQILADFGDETVRQIVVAHHEYKKNPYLRQVSDRRGVNRSGKDRRGFHESICELTQIVAVADIFDALTSHRSYNPPLSKEETEKILRDVFTGEQKYVEQVLLKSEEDIQNSVNYMP